MSQLYDDFNRALEENNSVSISSIFSAILADNSKLDELVREIVDENKYGLFRLAIQKIEDTIIRPFKDKLITKLNSSDYSFDLYALAKKDDLTGKVSSEDSLFICLLNAGAKFAEDSSYIADTMVMLAMKGREELVKCMLMTGQCKADIVLPPTNNLITLLYNWDYYNCTPLILAAENGHIGLVTILVGFGANINHVTNNGNTALYWALEKNHYNVAKYLLQKRALLNECCLEKIVTPKFIDNQKLEFTGNQKLELLRAACRIPHNKSIVFRKLKNIPAESGCSSNNIIKLYAKENGCIDIVSAIEVGEYLSTLRSEMKVGFGGIYTAISRAELATKQHDFATKAEVKKDLDAVCTDISKNKSAVEQQISDVKAEIKVGSDALNTRFSALEQNVSMASSQKTSSPHERGFGDQKEGNAKKRRTDSFSFFKVFSSNPSNSGSVPSSLSPVSPSNMGNVTVPTSVSSVLFPSPSR